MDEELKNVLNEMISLLRNIIKKVDNLEQKHSNNNLELLAKEIRKREIMYVPDVALKLGISEVWARNRMEELGKSSDYKYVKSKKGENKPSFIRYVCFEAEKKKADITYQKLKNGKIVKVKLVMGMFGYNLKEAREFLKMLKRQYSGLNWTSEDENGLKFNGGNNSLLH